MEKINKLNEKLYKLLEDVENPDLQKVRELIADEYNAVRKYGEFANEVNDQKLKKIFQDIQKEEEVHIGELREALRLLGYTETPEMDGADEVTDLLSNEDDK